MFTMRCGNRRTKSVREEPHVFGQHQPLRSIRLDGAEDLRVVTFVGAHEEAVGLCVDEFMIARDVAAVAQKYTGDAVKRGRPGLDGHSTCGRLSARRISVSSALNENGLTRTATASGGESSGSLVMVTMRGTP